MTHVLVPVAILEDESVSMGLSEFLAPVTVTVLGIHELPEQTPPDQARNQFEDRAMAVLEDICAEFEAAGGTAYSRLVFTHDRRKSIDRVAAEIEADAYVLPGVGGKIEKLLVSISGQMTVEPIVDFVTTIVAGRDIDVTLLWNESASDTDLTFSAVRTRFADSEVACDAKTVSGHFMQTVRDEIHTHDAVIMGEKASSLASLIFGDETERMAAESLGPVLVVRSPPLETTD